MRNLGVFVCCAALALVVLTVTIGAELQVTDGAREELYRQAAFRYLTP